MHLLLKFAWVSIILIVAILLDGVNSAKNAKPAKVKKVATFCAPAPEVRDTPKSVRQREFTEDIYTNDDQYYNTNESGEVRYVNQPIKTNAEHRPTLQRPKTIKQLTAYELCKQECRKKRDQESAKEYLERLREELKAAEEHVAQQEEQAANESKNSI